MNLDAVSCNVALSSDGSLVAVVAAILWHTPQLSLLIYPDSSLRGFSYGFGCRSPVALAGVGEHTVVNSCRGGWK